jgi:hypothetical protein
MKRSTSSAALWLLVVFLSGTAVGAVGYRLYTIKKVSADVTPPPIRRLSPQEFRKNYIEELRSKLKLDDGQVQKLGAILDETKISFDAERKRSQAAMKQIHDGQVASVRSILTDTQKPEYDKVHAEREKQRKEREDAEKRRRASAP